jgi:hypothetical protein
MKPIRLQTKNFLKITDRDDPLADFAGTPMPDLVECYMASDRIEAKFVADQLMEQGIPAIADRFGVASDSFQRSRRSSDGAQPLDDLRGRN